MTPRLAVRLPYDLQRLLAFLERRALPGVERVDASGYSRTLTRQAGPLCVHVRRAASGSGLALSAAGATPRTEALLATEARRVFDLDVDPADVAATLRADPLLRPLVARRPGLRVPGAWDPFECAVRAVLGQQVSVAAGRTLVTRLAARAGMPLPRPTRGLTQLFPSAAAIADADLAGLGLTSARAAALRALARAAADGTIDWGAATAEVTARLVALPGIGDWTAQYVALRALGDRDAFPAGDLVLRKAAAAGGPALTARALASRAEAWRPWRGYAVIHLWDAAAG